MEKIRAGIIGTGSISHLHMAGYLALKNVEVVACCDINEKRAIDFAKRYDVKPVFTEGEDVFAANFKAETAHFIDCIVNGTKCLNPVEDGVELMKILDAIYLSAQTGREILI